MNVSESALVSFLSHILGVTENDVRNAPGRYGAFHWDQGFDGTHEIDWRSSQVTTGHPDGALVYCRGDFDVANSFFDSESFGPDRTADTSLSALFCQQDRVLFGGQLQQLVAEGRLPKSAQSVRNVFGRIRGSGETLIDAARALWMLGDDTPWLPLDNEEDEYTEVDGAIAAKLAELFEPDVAAHIGLFFQTESAARISGGACLDAEPDAGIVVAQYLATLMPDTKLVATWSLCGGQGEEALVRLPDQHSMAVPAFDGETSLQRPLATT